MMEQLHNLAETRPLVVGTIGTAAGITSPILKYLQLVGDVAGSLGAIFGAVVAFLSIILLIKQLRK